MIPVSVCHVRGRVNSKNIEKWRRETGSLSASRRDVLTAYRVNILLRKCSCVQRSLTADIIDLKTGIRVYRVFNEPLIWFNRDWFYYKCLYDKTCLKSSYDKIYKTYKTRVHLCKLRSTSSAAHRSA